MQVKNNKVMDLLSKKKGLWSLVKVSVSLVCVAFIYLQLKSNGDIWVGLSLPSGFFVILPLLLGLMLINWSLEVYRWKVSVEPIERISLYEAITDVFGGLAMNWVMPFTSGDLMIRLSSKLDKHKATAAIMLNRGIMFIMTFLFGSYGVWFVGKMAFDLEGFWLILLLPTLILMKRFAPRFFEYFKSIDMKLFTKVVLISIARYIIFVVQFLIILYLFLPQLGLQILLAGIGWIFFFRSIIPSVLGGIGLREVSAFLFFQPYISDMSAVVVPVTIIWLVNTVLPSIFGSLLIWKLRFNIA